MTGRRPSRLAISAISAPSGDVTAAVAPQVLWVSTMPLDSPRRRPYPIYRVVALMILRLIEDHLRTQGPANSTRERDEPRLLHLRQVLGFRDIDANGVTLVIQLNYKVHGVDFVLEGAVRRPLGSPGRVRKAVHMEEPRYQAPKKRKMLAAKATKTAIPLQTQTQARPRGSAFETLLLQNGSALSFAEAGSAEVDDDEDERKSRRFRFSPKHSRRLRPRRRQRSYKGETDGQFRRIIGGKGQTRRMPASRRAPRRPGNMLESRTRSTYRVLATVNRLQNHDFPKNLAFGPISPAPIPPEPQQVIEQEIEKSTPAQTIPQAELLPSRNPRARRRRASSRGTQGRSGAASRTQSEPAAEPTVVRQPAGPPS